MESRRSRSSIDLEDNKKITISKKLFIIDIIVVAIIIVLATISIIHILTSDIDTRILENLNTHWLLSPFHGLELYQSNSNFFVGDFPAGTIGCECEENGQVTLTHGVCSEEQLQNPNCHKMDEFQALSLLQWGTETFQVATDMYLLFAIGEITYTNLYLSSKTRIIPGGKECPEHFKKCGVIDTLGQILCMHEEFDCPNNYLKNYKEPNNDAFTYIEKDIGNNKKLYLSNENENGIIYSTFTVDTDFPCVHPDEITSPFKHYQFFKNYNEEAYPCKTAYFNKTKNDLDYYFIDDNIPLQQFIQDNDINRGVMPFLTSHKSYVNQHFHNTTLTLYGRTYPGYNYSCLSDTMLPGDIYFYRPKTKEDYNNALFSLLISFIFLILSIACMLIIMFLYFSPKCLMIIRSVISILMFINFLLLICASLYLNSYDYSKSKCADKIISEVLEELNGKIQNHQIILWTLTSVSFLVFLMQLFGIKVQKQKNIEIASTTEVKTEYMLE